MSPVTRLNNWFEAVKIPFEQLGSRVVFRRNAVDVWSSQRLLGLKDHHLVAFHRSSSAKMHDLSNSHAILAELLHPDYFNLALASRTRSSVMRDMIELADNTSLVLDREALLESVKEREQLGTTALPGGFALLHPKHHEPYMFSDSFITIGRTIQDIPFGSMDGTTTNLFFLVCCQNDRIHLHVLARLCMICQQTDVIMQLREAEDSASAFTLVADAEQEVLKSCLST